MAPISENAASTLLATTTFHAILCSLICSVSFSNISVPMSGTAAALAVRQLRCLLISGVAA